MKKMALKKLICGLCLVAMGSIAMAQSVFDMPKLFPQHRQYLVQFVTALQRGDLLSAETAARAAVKIFPNDANWHYNVGCICSRDNRVEEALEWIGKAIELGYSDVRQLNEDADLKVVRQSPEFAKLVQRAQELQRTSKWNANLNKAYTDTVPLGTDAKVTETNTKWNWDPAQGGYMTTMFALAGDRKPNAEQYNGPYAEQIRAWMREGTAAGNAGDLYVNRDEDRTQIVEEKFPQLTSVVYSDEAQYARAHVGAANGIFSSGLVTHPVVGTSMLSLASTPFWRSLPRLIATETSADQLAFRLALMNQLYIYDVTIDYSAQLKGDLLTAAMPQVLMTYGTSTQPAEVKAAPEQLAELIFAGLAAMHPETKGEMLRRGLLVPTMQMLLRQSVKGAPAYCSAAAHPVAFNPNQIDGEAFVTAAHALKTEDLPALFQLVVRRETMPRQYIDYFDQPASERISDTPWSIKRVIRGLEKTRKLTVGVASMESGLTYQWFVSNGDPQKVRIRPLTKDASLVTVEVDYHGVFEQDGRPSRHVDIACVAMRKGKPASAPAFVSFRYLANERRVYDERGKLVQVDYTAPESGFVYEDPVLTAFKNWKDDYLYDAKGRLQGWTRTRPDGSVQQFDARGRKIVEKNPDGSAKRVMEVNYLSRKDAQSDAVSSPAMELLQNDTNRVLTL